MADSIKKEVLVVFGDRRRPVTYSLDDSKKEQSILLEETKKVFGDVLDGSSAFFFQTRSKKWDDQLVDVVNNILDGSTLYLFQESSSSTKVKYVHGCCL